MEEEEIPNFNSIKHRSIESASKTDLLINMSDLIFKAIIFTIIGLILEIIFYSSYDKSQKKSMLKYLQYCLAITGIILSTGGIYFLITIKYKFEFSFQGQKLILKISSFFYSNKIRQYFISKLDYIIIDQIHVEKDGEGRENALSIGNQQEEIPSKIIVNSIEEGYEEIFSGSGKPPLFTNDEVQFFNQFMKVNINRIKN